MPPSCRKKLRWNQHWNTLENYRSLLEPDWCRHTDHHQRVSLFTSAIPRTTQPTIKAPSTIFNLNYTVLYTTLRTQLYTQLYSTQLYPTTPTHHPVFSPQSATRSTPSPLSRFNPKDLTSRRLADETQDTDPPWKRGVLVKKKSSKWASFYCL